MTVFLVIEKDQPSGVYRGRKSAEDYLQEWGYTREEGLEWTWKKSNYRGRYDYAEVHEMELQGEPDHHKIFAGLTKKGEK